ncbi:MAG: FAD-dependent oxidoreductase, partial [Omnitrophica bacterium]|nr:FAD-dependent oxidoreductase [Candidatus Omnitrophota bacterium]
ANCVGIANRQGASCVVQIEVLPRPPECRTEDCPWPHYPMILKTSSSHEEGVTRKWSIVTKKFIGEGGRVKKILCEETSGGEFEIEADLVILAIGFVHPEHNGLLDKLGVKYDKKGNVYAGPNFMTTKEGIFTAGDMHRGQSLVMWAICEGLAAAGKINEYLKKRAKRGETPFSLD